MFFSRSYSYVLGMYIQCIKNTFTVSGCNVRCTILMQIFILREYVRTCVQGVMRQLVPSHVPAHLHFVIKLHQLSLGTGN